MDTNEKRIFKRYELKYLITEEQYDELMPLVQAHMRADEHGVSTVGSIYFDTPSHLLIRRSLEGHLYKEKLRMRFYGKALDPDQMFLEIKKKYNHVVYKRRITLAGYRDQEHPSQIGREIQYFCSLYEQLAPAALITCRREAWFDREDPELRLTFDRDILYRSYEGQAPDFLNNQVQHGPEEIQQLVQGLQKDKPGMALLKPGMVLLEVKMAMGYPRWLLDFLDKNHIYKQRFSKYGTGYALSQKGESPSAPAKETSSKKKEAARKVKKSA